MIDAVIISAIFAGIAGVLSAYGQYRISLNNREIAALKEITTLQERTIEALRVEVDVERSAREQLKRDLEAEKRLRATDQQTIQGLKDRIAELEGVDKRRRRGMGQFEERGLG